MESKTMVEGADIIGKNLKIQMSVINKAIDSFKNIVMNVNDIIPK